jgi:predicted nucleic acid-binding protein
VIVVDSSVWIANLRGEATPATRRLLQLHDSDDEVMVGDLVLMEILRGATSEYHAATLALEFTSYGIVPMMNEVIALAAAQNYRRLRGRGITLRSSVDLIIATFCIEGRHLLLHQDRDFDPCERYLGLRVY